MTVLVTGACGFAGSTICISLLDRCEGLTIFGLDNLIRSGGEINRERLRKAGVRFFHADLRSAADLEFAPGADWVIDAAANPSVLAGVAGQSSRQLFEHNIGGLGNVLEYCRRHTAGLCLLSSSRVYSIAALADLPLRMRNDAYEIDDTRPLPDGASAHGIAREFSTRPPLSLYGSTKLASEILALEYGAAFGFPVWITRCGNLAGEGQFGTRDQGIFSWWIHSHLRRRPLRYTGFGGTGSQVRDLLHPADLAALLLTQMHSTHSGTERVFTAGGGSDNAISLARLNSWCDERFGANPVTKDPEPRPFDVPWLVMDNREAMQRLNWRIEIPLPQILDRIARHATANPSWLELSGA